MMGIDIKGWDEAREGKPWEVEISEDNIIWDSPKKNEEYFEHFWDLIIFENLYAAEFGFLFEDYQKYKKIVFFCKREIDFDHAQSLRAFLITKWHLLQR